MRYYFYKKIFLFSIFCIPFCSNIKALECDQNLIPRYSNPIEVPEIYVDTTQQLCPNEKYYVYNRKPFVINEIKNFIKDQTIRPENLPNIAFCFSGGGYRAMISCLGFCLGAEKIGLLNTADYIATLSGSTWFLTNWLARNMPLELFKEILKHRVNCSFFNPGTMNKTEIIKKLLTILTQRGKIETCEFWGALLCDHLLGDIKDNQNLSFQTIRQNLKNSLETQSFLPSYPFPIFTSVVADVDPYLWVETSPYSTGSDFIGGKIPTPYFSSKFEHGRSTYILPEEFLSTYMGVFGSPYSLSFGDILYNLALSLGYEPLTKIILKLIKDLDLYKKRILPSPFNNFTYQLDQSIIKNLKEIRLIDAGVSEVNIPFITMLKKERNIDIIVVCDASADALQKGYPEIKRAKDLANLYGFKFPAINTAIVINEDLTIFQDIQDRDCPIVVYFSNPVPEATLKFDYSFQEFEQLSGSMEILVKNSSQILAQVIRQKIRL